MQTSHLSMHTKDIAVEQATWTIEQFIYPM